VSGDEGGDGDAALASGEVQEQGQDASIDTSAGDIGAAARIDRDLRIAQDARAEDGAGGTEATDQRVEARSAVVARESDLFLRGGFAAGPLSLDPSGEPG
jgi:hypothetical protein